MGENTHSLAESKQAQDMARLPTNPIGRSCDCRRECRHSHYATGLANGAGSGRPNSHVWRVSWPSP
jgi:hypothetical protein